MLALFIKYEKIEYFFVSTKYLFIISLEWWNSILHN